MAIKGKSASAAAGAGPALAGPALAGPSLSVGTLTVPKGQDLWTWMVSPTSLHCYQGEIVPMLAKAWFTAGLGGNGRIANGHGFQAMLQGHGYQPIPHNFPAVAFGEDRSTAELSTYLDRHEGVSQGSMVVYHCDAWHRPRRLGAMTMWDFDAPGWKAWLVSVRDELIGELHPSQVDMAVAPLARAIRRLSERDDKRAARGLREHLAHMPRQYCPDDLVSLLDGATAGA